MPDHDKHAAGIAVVEDTFFDRGSLWAFCWITIAKERIEVFIGVHFADI